tara:strand:- start:2005 stop:2313 length:309 start_codon:yes stop_codon:yes gene_type:complete
LNNDQFTPNAISHKDLNALLDKAKKEVYLLETSINHENEKNQEFENLLTEWTEASQKILLILNSKQQLITKNKNPRSIMALGAMGAHINMALQALKATETDQ